MALASVVVWTSHQNGASIQCVSDLASDPDSSCPSYPDGLTIREARDRFLAFNGFQVEDYSAPTYAVKLWKVRIRFPNTKAHRWAAPLHDLHHVLTGYKTDWIGEAEIAAWELRAGCRTVLVYWLDLSGAAIGLLISAVRVCRAFCRARGQRTLYHDPTSYDSMLRMTLGEVRARLGIPPGGLIE